MTSDIRAKAPAGWIALPVLLASATSTLAAWATESPPLGAAGVLLASLPAAWWAERRPDAEARSAPNWPRQPFARQNDHPIIGSTNRLEPF